MNKIKSKFTHAPSSLSTRSTSSRAGSDINIDEPTAGAAAPTAQGELNFLMDEKDIRWRSRQEKDKFKLLKPRFFTLTSVYSPQLLQDTCMDAEFNFIFQVVGRQNF